MIKHITLWEIVMQKFDVGAFIYFANLLGYHTGIQDGASTVYEGEIEDLKNMKVEDVERESLTNRLKKLKSQCISMPVSVIQIDRMIERLSHADITQDELKTHEDYLSNCLSDEMKSKLFFYIEPNKQQLFMGKNPFGEEVIAKFPSTIIDIEEAGKCIAFERYTAAVYHLGRVSEAVLVIICERIGYHSPKRGFGEALRFIDNGLEKVRKDYQNASPLFKGDVEFLSSVAVQMHAVNGAWRQRVAHIERNYNEEEALRIWDATKGLMQQLATKLKDG
jgi:hypothetical protein